MYRCCSCNSCLSLILFACLLKLAHDLHSYGCSVVTLWLSCLLFLMHCLLYLHAFIHPHWCISFRYARWTTRAHEARDDGTEPQDGVGGRVLKRKEPARATKGPAQGLVSTNTDFVSNPGKPRSITLNFSIQCLLYNYCAFTFLGVDWNLRCVIPRFPQ